MLTREINKEQVLLCGEHLLKMLSPKEEHHQQLMKKSLLLYRQGLVYNLSVSNAVVRATVQDVTPVSVSLDFDYFPMSSCSCRQAFPCRHTIAVLFYVYARYDLLGSFLEAWKNTKPISTVDKLKSVGLIRKGSDVQGESITGWYNLFKEEWKPYEKHVASAQQKIHLLVRQIYSSLKVRPPWKQELKPLYQLHASFFILKKILECLHEPVQKSLMDYTVYPYIDKIREDVEMHTENLRQIRHSFSLEPYLAESVPYVRELLTVSPLFRFERMTMYRRVWLHVLRAKQELVAEEKTWLQEALQKERDENGSYVIEYDVALLNIHFLQKEDEKVVKRLSDFDAMMMMYSLDWFGEVVRMKAWDRFSVWKNYYFQFTNLFFMQPIDSYTKRQVADFLLHLFEEYMHETDDVHALKEMCQQLLPYSYPYLDDLLLDEEDYGGWLDLQDFMELDVEELDASVLKIVEKNAPDLLLPLVHRSVARCISEKNRGSYKQAVKHLKRLKRLYKKLKKLEVWESYFMNLVEQNKRLRAFQEELRKGKLLDV